MAGLTDERREVAARLRDNANKHGVVLDYLGGAQVASWWLLLHTIGCNSNEQEVAFNMLADLIENGEPDTCVYEPTESVSYWDENDREHETNRPSEECSTFACSRCGYEMLYGEAGWFDEEPPYTPHFKRCPECGCRVVSMTLYDRVVGDGR